MHTGFVLAASLAFAACMPAKAPGSNPEDMTTDGHRAAAQQEQREAESHHAQASRVQPTKPANEAMQRKQHRDEAARHRKYAADHQGAAEAVEAGEPR